ncbi:uncharacterized protein LOC114754340 [Neltuma alba]|uniref:uncharacterized protein LOC114754340 n=1 Tax=Neltuma alba TaxID=207710 RepID=UPI0010A38D72|nr:uncharacterized protein LOC114754340 [Prosopis alba]
MAKEVAHKLKESKSIDKFIFLVVSQPPDFKKIREDLAKGLGLIDLIKEVNEEDLLNRICSKITNMGEKLLIILDDVWKKFDLTGNLGIPSEHHYKGYKLLITTRNLEVCTEMGCQQIKLQMLTDEEALNLFETHATHNSSSRGLKGMPQKIVKHCGGLPIAILAIAKALKNQPRSFWKYALKTLEDHGVDQNLEEAYKCLKLSYDNLKNQKARKLFLISSLFPEDFEIPIKVLIKIGIGLGSVNEIDNYHLTTIEVHGAIMELISSSLLLNGKEGCVRMHDLVREVALWIGENDIQFLVETPIRRNLRYLSWRIDYFPDEFDGNKLEVLLLFLDELEDLNVLDTVFKGMTSLKVLLLINVARVPALSLMNSLEPLKDIRTLILQSLKLGDIRALGNLLSLNTLQFLNCSIIELPREFLKLKKLGSLEVERCKIEKNNPFKVIERCTQLEELTFVANRCDNEENNAISENGSPLTLHRYCISSEDLSKATFKQLVKGAELLILEGKDAPRIWKNSILDDIVATDDRGMMNDLIVLHLSSCPYVEFPIDTKDHDSGVAGFCNLFGLHLSNVEVEDLCHGPLPSGVWEQLGIMKLNQCHRLKSILSNGNYNLCHLKSMKLEHCPMLASVFQPSTARSLMRLEKLTISNCSALECIMVSEDSDSNLKSYHDSLFPKLKKLRIGWCSKLRRILPILFAGGLASLEMLSIYQCEQLEYMFDKFEEGEDAMLPSLEELELSGVPSFIGMCKEHDQLVSSSMQKPSSPHSRHNCSSNMNQSPARRAFSWVQACCSLNKLRPASEDTKITVPEQRPHDHTVPQELDSSTCGVFLCHAVQSLLVQSLKNVREIILWECGNILSLSTLSIAASTISLESLSIRRCHKLKCITTHEGYAQVDNKNYCSIFPTLENLEIEYCKELEFLFQSAISGGLQKLKSLKIWGCPKLKCITTHEGDAQVDNKNYCSIFPTLENLEIWNCEELEFVFQSAISGGLQKLKSLKICGCHKLKCITTHEGDAQVDNKNYCSIFPTLEKLEIKFCRELEFVFRSSISGGLQKLKSLTIRKVPELKYVVGKHQQDQQNEELHFDLPALATLYIEDAPKIKSICAKNYKMDLASLQNVELCNCSIKSFDDYDMVNLPTSEELDASTEGVPPFLVSQSLLVQSLRNVRKIILRKCGNILSLSTLSIAASTISLESLSIRECHKLKCITTHEGYAQVDNKNYCSIFPTLENLEIWNCEELKFLFQSAISGGLQKLKSLKICGCHKLKCITTHEGDAQVDNKNYCSIFPTLEKLEIKFCRELEFVFRSSISGGLQKLKSLTIRKVPELKYVVGKYQQDQQKEELHFDLPALATLYIEDAPKIKSICAKNYKMDLASLQNVELCNCSIKSFDDYDMVNLPTSEVYSL